MLLSVFTPTNNPKFLGDCLRSLELQDYENWEWVLAPNGEAVENIPAEIVRHPKVRILKYSGPPRIGAMKKFCCDYAQGDVFVELDHDDMLVPDVLSKVAAKASEGPGFIFSDTAIFVDAESSYRYGSYDARYGWESYEVQVFDKYLTATRNFEVTARSLCEIFFAPDHVRCWTRDAYEKVGGHDTSLEVGDDHDLMCRTYLAHYPFHYTGGCGYLYRNHSGNTVKSHNSKIQEQQAKNRDKYLYRLVDEWTVRNRLGYVDLDVSRERFFGFDAKNRLRIYWDDNSVGSIRAFNMLEHIPQEHVNDFMEECYRVLVPGGWLCVRAPSTEGYGAFAPHHRSYWNKWVFNFWTDAKFAKKMGGTKARFQNVRTWTETSSEDGYPVVYSDLCALKTQRQPGRCYI